MQKKFTILLASPDEMKCNPGVDATSDTPQ